MAYQKLPLAVILNWEDAAVTPQSGPLFSGSGGGQPAGMGPVGGGPPENRSLIEVSLAGLSGGEK